MTFCSQAAWKAGGEGLAVGDTSTGSVTEGLAVAIGAGDLGLGEVGAIEDGDGIDTDIGLGLV
jgi:hypothetical protein